MGLCTQEQAAEIIAQLEKRDQWRADQMPTEQHALIVWMQAWLRLKEFGWREIIYCPKDGTEFDAIEPGSTGIHRCIYKGEWPNGAWWVLADGDMFPSHPALFRLAPHVDPTPFSNAT